MRKVIREELDSYFSDATITISEAARRLEVSRPTIYRWIESGKLEVKGNKITLRSIRLAI